MPVPSSDIVRSKLAEMKADVHSIQVDATRSILVYDATYEENSCPIPSIPVLFMVLCIGGGGRIIQKTRLQDMDSTIEPGDIGIAAPSASGHGSWPELRVIGLGIEINALLESFGEKWPNRLRRDVISKPFRDPLVETTMMQIGYTQAGQASDTVLKYAAQMIVHQLLDDPFEIAGIETPSAEVYPLSEKVIGSIKTYVAENFSRQIQVDELAQLTGVSRYHFSRRFKAATGITPYQFVLQMKLDKAAADLTSDTGNSIIDVAQSVGFDNPARFAKAFRRRFGQAPRFWRNLGLAKAGGETGKLN